SDAPNVYTFPTRRSSDLTVIAWRDRYVSSGMQGLRDEQRSGRPRTVDRGEILAATLTPPPARLGITHWSSRLLAEFLKVDASTRSEEHTSELQSRSDLVC